MQHVSAISVTTTRWLTAAFQDDKYRRKSLSIQFNPAKLDPTELSIAIGGVELDKTSCVNYGPVQQPDESRNSESVASPDEAIKTSPVDNPCIFLHYYKMKRRLVWMRPMKAAAGVATLPSNGDEDGNDNAGPNACPAPQSPLSEAEDDMLARCGKTTDPVDPLLSYILEVRPS